MTLRPFTPTEEQALLRMLGQPRAAWRPIPPAPGKCPYNRLAALGCAQVMSQGSIRSARLTETGRYFATLLAQRWPMLATDGNGTVVTVNLPPQEPPIEPFPLPASVSA